MGIQPVEGLQPLLPSAFADRLARLEVLKSQELRCLVHDLVEENHSLRERLRLGWREALLRGNTPYSGPPERRHGGEAAARQGTRELQELQQQASSLVACIEEQASVIEMLEQEITTLTSSLADGDEHLEKYFQRKDGQRQQLLQCRHATAHVLEQIQATREASVPASSALTTAVPPSPRCRPSSREQVQPAPEKAAPAVTATAGPTTSRGSIWRDLRPAGILRLTVLVMPGAFARTASKVLLQVAGAETPVEVKQRLVKRGVAWGPPDEQTEDQARTARLLHRGMALASDISLAAQGVCDGHVLRLLPSMGRERLRCACDGQTWHATAAQPALGPKTGSSAPRGLLANPGTRPWPAADSQRGPEELVPDAHTERALLEAHRHHRSLFAQPAKLAVA